jgi:endoglucanase
MSNATILTLDRRVVHLASALAFLVPMGLGAGCADPSSAAIEDSSDASDHALPNDAADDSDRHGRRLYASPTSNAATQAGLWQFSDPVGSAMMSEIAAHQNAIWVGDWTGDVTSEVDAAVTQAGTDLQTFVVYDIPNRDCGAWSAGGAANGTEYANFIDDFAAGLDGRHALVILEPDGLPLEDCLSAAQVTEREQLMFDAVDTISAAGGRVYIDAGDSDWIPSGDMAAHLTAAGVGNAAGFSLNVSHTETTADSIGYAEELRGILGDSAHYVVDTGRNGVGPTADHQWCNPLGRAVGEFPSLSTGVTGMDASLWVKPPGESDGSCNGGPPAGQWWADYARDLAEVAGL